MLPQVCEVYLAAREAGVLYASQLHIAERAEKLVRGLAAVGIIALVDEATGYQQVREKRALAAFLDRYLTDEMRAWTRTFPHEFYKEIYRLRGWGDVTNGKPAVIGRDTNEIIYERVAPAVLDELQERNPTLPGGRRRHRHHQWFSEEYGHPRLKEHLAAVIVLMRSAPSWPIFMHRLNVAIPKPNSMIAMAMDGDSG